MNHCYKVEISHRCTYGRVYELYSIGAESADRAAAQALENCGAFYDPRVENVWQTDCPRYKENAR